MTKQGPFLQRKVDLNSYLPKVIGEAKEIKEMNRVEDVEFNQFWERLNKMFNNRFILSADERGLERWEELLNIKPSGELEERRNKVYYEWNKSIKYTDRTVRKTLDGYLGKGNYTLNIRYEEYIVEFMINLFENPNLDLNKQFDDMREIIPANMGLERGLWSPHVLTLNTAITAYLFDYYLCGVHECGTIPNWATLMYHSADNGVEINPKAELYPDYFGICGEVHCGEGDILTNMVGTDEVFIDGGYITEIDSVTKHIDFGEVK